MLMVFCINGSMTDPRAILQINSRTSEGDGRGPTFWMVKKYFVLFYLTISITYRNNLPYILLRMLRFSPTNPTLQTVCR